MKLFGRKSAGRGSLRPALLRGYSSWIGGDIPQSYDERVRAAYMTNPVAQRAVRLVADGVAAAPILASEPSLLPLVTARSAGQTLLETVATHLLLHGNAFVQVLTGEFGEVEVKDGGFAVGLRGPTAVLDAAVVEETSPECRAQLGDRRCRVDLSGRRVSAVVVSVVDSVVTLAGALSDGDFAYGALRWLTGDNAGLESRVVANTGATMSLRDVPAFAVTTGTRVELTQGCDKRFATCIARFGNAVNFRGEPHLPGNDLLTRYGD